MEFVFYQKSCTRKDDNVSNLMPLFGQKSSTCFSWHVGFSWHMELKKYAIRERKILPLSWKSNAQKEGFQLTLKSFLLLEFPFFRIFKSSKFPVSSKTLESVPFWSYLQDSLQDINESVKAFNPNMLTKVRIQWKLDKKKTCCFWPSYCLSIM